MGPGAVRALIATLRPTIQASEWWEWVVFRMNRAVLRLVQFVEWFMNPNVLLLVFAAWLLVMHIWFRTFSVYLQRVYWVLVLIYYVFLVLYFTGNLP